MLASTLLSFFFFSLPYFLCPASPLKQFVGPGNNSFTRRFVAPPRVRDFLTCASQPVPSFFNFLRRFSASLVRHEETNIACALLFFPIHSYSVSRVLN